MASMVAAAAGAQEASHSQVRVFLRLRPLNKYEVSRRSRKAVDLVDPKKAALSDDNLEFDCDGVFDDDASQQQVYEQTCPSVPQQLLDGFHCTVVAYGASGTGKTHTLLSSGNSSTSSDDPEDEIDDSGGIIGRLASQIFESVSKSDASIEFTVRCSVIEIYLERLRDLLQDSSKVRLKSVVGQRRNSSCTDDAASVVLVGCSALSCVSADDVVRVVQRGTAARTCSATDPNRDSTRSSCLVQLQIEQLNTRTGIRTCSRLHVIDLVASELMQTNAVDNARTTLEAAQVSFSLKAFHKYVRELKDGKRSSAVNSDLPAITKLLVSSLAEGVCSAHTAFILTASPSNSSVQETANTLRFGLDLRQLCTTPLVHAMETVDVQEATDKLAAALEKQDRLDTLVKCLAAECQRLRDKRPWDRVLWPIVEQITATTTPCDDNSKLRKLDFSIESKEEHETKLERMRQYAKLKKADQERDEAVSERDQLCSDLVILQAQNIALKEQQSKLQEEVSTLKRDNAVLHHRKHEVDHNLRTSQFRESEAVVFMRQLRRFYYRLLKKTAADGTGEIADITQRVPGAPDLVQLVDIDHLMMESGLIEKRDVGGDVSMDCRPSREALERSKTQAELAAAKALVPETTLAGGDSAAATDVAPVIRTECVPPLATSILRNAESSDKVEARQKLYQTPAGRCVTMREKMLEEELLQMSELNSRLRTQLEEEKTNVEALTDKHGVSVAKDKMRIAQETRLLKDQLARKNNDLKAVIWKMNELHMIGTTLKTQSQNREPHMGYLEEKLAGASNQNGISLAERRAEEKRLRDEIRSLQRQVESVSVPVWHLSETAKAKIPLSCRLVVPFTSNGEDLETDPESNRSTGEPGEWMDYDFYPSDRNRSEAATQTVSGPILDVSTQTESVHVVDRTKMASIAIQTDDIYILNLSQRITEDNLDNFMFMESPDGPERPRLNGSGSGIQFESLMEDIPVICHPTFQDYVTPLPPNRADDYTYNDIAQKCPPPSTDLTTDQTNVAVAVITDALPMLESPERNWSAQVDSLEVSKFDADALLFAASSLQNPRPFGRQDRERPSPRRSPMKFKAYSDIGERTIKVSDVNLGDLTAANGPVRVTSAATSSSFLKSMTTETLGSAANALLFMEDSEVKLKSFGESEVTAEKTRSAPEDERATVSSMCTKDHLESQPSIITCTVHLQTPVTNLETAKSCSKLPPSNRMPMFKSQSESPTRSPRKQSGPHLSSFLDKLQKQSQRKLEDDDEKTTTPEFMKMFRKIGGKNQNEAVLETSGAAPARDATRTSFEQLRHNSQSVNKPVTVSSIKKWTPRQKKKDDDDSSDSDDSFAKQFMGGAQMADTGRVKPAMVMGDDSERSKSDTQGDPKDDDSCNGEPHSNTATPPAAATSRFAGAVAPKPSTPTSRLGLNDDSDSSSSDDESKAPVKPVAVAPKPAVVAPKPSATTSRSGTSDDDSKALAKPFATAPTPVAAGPTTAATTTSLFGRKNDSDSDSSEDESTLPVKPVSAAPTRTAGAPTPAAGMSSRFGRKNDSDSDSSDDESTVPAKPVAAAASKPLAVAPTPSAGMSSRFGREDESDSDSSDDEAKVPAKNAATPKPVVATPTPVAATTSRFGRKDESDSDSSDDEAKAPRELVAVPMKPTALPTTTRFGRRGDSDSDSSDDESKAKAKPVALASKPTAPTTTRFGHKGDSDSDSSDDESKAPAMPAAVAPKPTATVTSRSASKDDSDSDSSDEESKAPAKPVAVAPMPAATLNSRLASKCDSDSDSSDDESKASAKPVAVAPKHAATVTSRSALKAPIAFPSKPISTATASNPEADDSSDEASSESDDESSQGAAAAKKKATAEDESSDDDESEEESSDEEKSSSSEDESGSESTGIIDLTNHKEPNADGKEFVGGKAANAKPKTKVPDFSSKVTKGLSPGSKGEQGTKRHVQNGKLVKSDATKIPPDKSKKAKFVVRDGKLVKVDDNADSKSKGKPKAKKPAFVIKDGKLVKKDSSALNGSSSSSLQKTKPAFTIVGGKLVKAKDNSKDDSEGSDKTPRQTSKKTIKVKKTKAEDI